MIGSQLDTFENAYFTDAYANKLEVAPSHQEEEPLSSRQDYLNAPSALNDNLKKYGKPNQIGSMVTEDELQTFEPGMAQKIRECLVNRDKAANANNYELVVTLRDAIEFLRDKAREYRQCLHLKSIAIENEDYEVAKRLKF